MDRLSRDRVKFGGRERVREREGTQSGVCGKNLLIMEDFGGRNLIKTRKRKRRRNCVEEKRRKRGRS